MNLAIGLIIGALATMAVVSSVDLAVGRAPKIDLPRRTPGATFLTEPLPHPKESLRATARAWVGHCRHKLAGWIPEIIESEDNFRTWWADVYDAERKRLHRGRHRRDELSRTSTWRTRWAEWPTQAWPTQSTTGAVEDLAECRDHFPINYLSEEIPVEPLLVG